LGGIGDLLLAATRDTKFEGLCRGKMRMTDGWDFDPKEGDSRPVGAEAATPLGQVVPGAEFEIDSGELRVHGDDYSNVEVDGPAMAPKAKSAKE